MVDTKKLKAAPVERTERYMRNDLRAQSESLFNVKPEIIDGALSGYDQDQFSVDELQGLIDTFLNRTVN